MKRHSQRRSSPVTEDDLHRLLFVCGQDPEAAGRRDAALIVLACSLGIPEEAILGLPVDSYSPETRILNVRSWAGKVAINSGVAGFLDAWLPARRAQTDLLFPSDTGGDHLPLQTINHILLRRSGQAGIPAFSLFDIGRTHALLCCGQWRAGCCSPYPPGVEIIPLPVAELPDSQPAASHDNDLIIFGYLSRLTPSSRTLALDLLNDFVRLLKPETDARCFPWAGLRLDDLPSPGVLHAAFDPRTVRIARRAVNGVIRQAALLGMLDERIAFEMQRRPWIQRSGAGS